MDIAELNKMPAGIYCVELNDRASPCLVEACGDGWWDGMGFDDGCQPVKILGGPWTVDEILKAMLEAKGGSR